MADQRAKWAVADQLVRAKLAVLGGVVDDRFNVSMLFYLLSRDEEGEKQRFSALYDPIWLTEQFSAFLIRVPPYTLMKTFPARPGADLSFHPTIFEGKEYSCGSNYTIVVRDYSDDSLITTLRGHSKGVTCLTIFEGKLYSSSADHTIKVWNCRDDSLITTLEGHAWGVLVLCVQDCKLYSGSDDCTIMIWNCTDHSLVGTLRGHNGSVKYLTAADGKLYSGSYHPGSRTSSIRVWNCSNHALKSHLKHVHNLSCLAVNDGKVYSATHEDKGIRIWDDSNKEVVASFSGHTKPVTDFTFQCGKLYSKQNRGEIKVWKL